MEPLCLADDVFEGVVEPLVEADLAVVVDVHLGEVLPPLGEAGLVRGEHGARARGQAEPGDKNRSNDCD